MSDAQMMAAMESGSSVRNQFSTSFAPVIYDYKYEGNYADNGHLSKNPLAKQIDNLNSSNDAIMTASNSYMIRVKWKILCWKSIKKLE